MPFQSRINRTLPVGVEGDFASTNPYHSLLNASGGQYKAGASGVIVGRFAWVDDATGLAVNAKGSLTRGSFVKRANTATVLTPGQEYSLTIRGGFEVELFDGGDFYARFAAGATSGQNVFANDTTGVLVADAGATLAGHTITPFKVVNTVLAGELAKITGWIK